MKTKQKDMVFTDIRDEVRTHLFEVSERNYAWLKRKTGIAYGSLYSMFKQKTMKVKPDDLEKISEALGTTFDTNGKEGFEAEGVLDAKKFFIRS